MYCVNHLFVRDRAGRNVSRGLRGRSANRNSAPKYPPVDVIQPLTFGAMEREPIEPGARSRLLSIRLGESQAETLDEIVASDPDASRGAIIRAALAEYLPRRYPPSVGAA
jgi:hypothetical protein